MTQKVLLNALDKLDKQNIWAFNINMLRLYFYENSDQALAVALGRHTKSNLITRVCRGIYSNPRAKSTPKYPLEALACIIRSGEQFYLSLETLLSESGHISQMPNRLTFMTTGRTQTFQTPYGILEFVHSQRDPKDFLNGCSYNNERKIWIASAQKALRDAKRTGRSLDLINLEGIANGTV
ncbi:MAG: hypothetical protein PHN38_10000 [Sulfurospirillaceae bacterium]|nr:hypothetical protein [Sulfurospirillaceae bacterium]